MLGVFSIGLKSLLFLAIVTLCLVAALISQLDEHNRIREKTHIPHIPVLNHQGGRDVQTQSPLDPLPNSPDGVSSGLPEEELIQEPVTPQDIEEERKEHHPIDHLIDAGQKHYDSILKKETRGVEEAASAYRKRRGRQPPPHFDQWVRFAEEHNAVMVEDFFDQIYHDTDPFWGIPAVHIRDAARAWKCFISIREGEASQVTDIERPWMNLWTEMISQIADRLPDMDIAINEMDESRIMVPWESVDQYLELAEMRYSKFPASREAQITTYPSRFNNTRDKSLYNDHGFHTLGYIWSLAQEACPPDSPGRNANWDDVDYKLRVYFPQGYPDGSYQGYVSNWTYAKDPCQHPHLREMHGSFVEPISMSTSAKMVPMFGGSKLPMNNDILLPAAMYWTDDPFYKGTEKRVPWEEKETGVMWRGAASGGRNRATNWRRFQRHRFVSMMNGTQVHAQELLNAMNEHPDLQLDIGDADSLTPHNFPLPRGDTYDLAAQQDGRLGPWMDSFADAKVTHLLCFPAENHNGPNCSYSSPYYQLAHHTPTEDQYKFKYLPDIDGNSFSGRYRGFLRSYSLPIKATVYNEWHDSRLFPWKHFIPMDNTFVDFYGIMEYFLGYDPADTGPTTIGSGPEGEAPATAPPGVDENLRRAHALEVPAPEEAASPDPPAHEALSRDYASPIDDLNLTPQNPPQPLPKTKRQTPNPNPKPVRKKHPHDQAAKMIAEDGHEWAEKVLRKEDMLIYVYRLLLEYARLASDKRENMGWVGDGIVVGVNDQKERGPGQERMGRGGGIGGGPGGLR